MGDDPQDSWARQGPAFGRESKRTSSARASAMFAALAVAEEYDFYQPPLRPLGRQPSIRDFRARKEPAAYADLTDSEDEEPLQLNRWYMSLNIIPQNLLPSSVPSAQTRPSKPVPATAKVQTSKNKAVAPVGSPSSHASSIKQPGPGSPQPDRRSSESRPGPGDRASPARAAGVRPGSDTDSDLDPAPPRSSKPRSGGPASPARSPVRSPVRSPRSRRTASPPASPARGAGASRRQADTQPVPLGGPLVQCFMCQKRMPEAQFSRHVEEELAEQDRREKQAQEDKDIAFAKTLDSGSGSGSRSAPSPELVILKPARIPRKSGAQEQPGPGAARKRKRRQTISSDDDEEEDEKPKRAKTRPETRTQEHDDHEDSIWEFPQQSSHSQEY